MRRWHEHSRHRLARWPGAPSQGSRHRRDGPGPVHPLPARGSNDRLLAWEFSAGLKDWEQAPAPAQIGRRVVEGVFQRQLPPQRAALVNNLMHWGYGIARGGLFGLVAGSLRAPKVRHGLVLGATAWSASYVLLPLAGLYRPIWEYDTKVLAKDSRRPPGVRGERGRRLPWAWRVALGVGSAVDPVDAVARR